MKKPYEEPELIIELFLDTDIIVCSGWGGESGGDEPDPDPDW